MLLWYFHCIINRGKDKVDLLLENNLPLKLAYEAKELALAIFSCKDKALFVELLGDVQRLYRRASPK